MSEVRDLPPLKAGRLSDLVELVRDKCVPTAADTDIPCINLTDIREGSGRIVSESRASENLSIKTKFGAGDILFCKLRPYLRKFAQPSFPGVCTSELLVFRAKPEVDPRYAYQVVGSSAFIDFCVASSFGTKMPRTDWRTVSAFPVQFPVKAEQSRIAELLAVVDENIAAIERRAAKLSLIKAALANSIFTARKSVAPYPVRALRALISRLDSGVSVNADDSSRAASSDVCVLKTSCVTQGRFLPEERKVVRRAEASRVRTPVKAGTLIISRMNTPELVGECGLVEADYPSLFLPDRLWQASLVSSDTSASWLNECLQWAPIRKQVRDIATGTSNSMKNISKDSFLSIEIPVPPPKEQRAIAGILNGISAQIDVERQASLKYRALKAGLLHALLAPSASDSNGELNEP